MGTRQSMSSDGQTWDIFSSSMRDGGKGFFVFFYYIAFETSVCIGENKISIKITLDATQVFCWCDCRFPLCY